MPRYYVTLMETFAVEADSRAEAAQAARDGGGEQVGQDVQIEEVPS
jgi:hypothetical protein